MPTVTTTVTSAAASGVVTTQTITEATPEPPAPAPAPASVAPAAASDEKHYPIHVKGITAEWLGGVLGVDGEPAPVAGFKCRPVDAMGFQAETYFVTVFYFEDEKEDGLGGKYPTKVVCKVTSPNQANFDIAHAMRSYEKEAKAYQRLQIEQPGLLPISMPKAYGAFGDLESCMLVLEDLRGAGSLVDQIVGGTETDAKNMLSDIGKLHGTFINAPLLDEKWLAPDGKEKFVHPGMVLAKTFKTVNAWPHIQDVWKASPLKKEAVDASAFPETVQICKMFVTDQADALWDKITANFQSRSFRVLNHGDPRGDNSFRRSVDGSIVWFDWQMAHTAVPAVELAHQNQQTFKPDGMAQKHEAMLKEHYYDTMADLAETNGVPDFRTVYTYDDCMYDYKLGHILYGLAVMAVLLPIVEEQGAVMPQRSLEVLDGMIVGICNALERNNCLQVVKDLAASL